MIALHLTEVKSFMAKLLMNNVFDHFILRELEIQTYTTFRISGQFHDAFFTKEELEERGNNNYLSWGEVKSIALSMIKGNKSPLAMKLVLQLEPQGAEGLINSFAGKLKPEDVGGLFLNIRFEKGILHIITGAAIKTFTLDKSLEQRWDKVVMEKLREHGIVFEEE